MKKVDNQQVIKEIFKVKEASNLITIMKIADKINIPEAPKGQDKV